METSAPGSKGQVTWSARGQPPGQAGQGSDAPPDNRQPPAFRDGFAEPGEGAALECAPCYLDLPQEITILNRLQAVHAGFFTVALYKDAPGSLPEPSLQGVGRD